MSSSKGIFRLLTSHKYGAAVNSDNNSGSSSEDIRPNAAGNVEVWQSPTLSSSWSSFLPMCGRRNSTYGATSIAASYYVFVMLVILMCTIPTMFKDQVIKDTNNISSSSGLQHFSNWEGSHSESSTNHHPHETVPTLLSIMTSNNQYANALQNDLYEEMLSPNTQYIITSTAAATTTTTNDDDDDDNNQGSSLLLRSDSSSSSTDSKNNIILRVSKTEINFHEPISVSWGTKVIISDDDIIALYCPASETNPRQFQDAATIHQVKLMAASAKNSDKEMTTWHIEAFPIIREESCEFRLYSRILLASPPTVRSGDDGRWKTQHPHPTVLPTMSTTSRRTLLSSSQLLYYHQIATSATIHIKNTLKPTAIHLALSENTKEMRVLFVSGERCSTIHPSHTQHNSTCVIIPIVRYYEGSKGNDNTEAALIKVGTSTTYKASDMCSEPANVTAPGKFRSPGLLHVVTLEDLVPNTRYAYQPGVIVLSEQHSRRSLDQDILRHLVLDGDDSIVIVWSDDTFSFKSSPLPHQNESFSFLVYGDQGCPATGWTMGAKVVAQRMERELSPSYATASKPQVRAIHHFGDLAYAKGAGHVYDFWFHMIQPLVSKVPYMIGIGNHEYLHYTGGESGKDPSGETSPGGFRPPWNNFGNDSGGECGVPISKRFQMPNSSGSNGVFWYSFEFSSTHVIMLSSEHDLSSTSRQYQWLESDLRSVNRLRTPWVIVEIHRPLYNSFNLPDGQNAVGIAMREEFELLLREYSVDLVLSGHYHSYLRTCNGLFQGICNNGGPTYITIGTAGAELSYAPLYDQNWTEASFVEWGYGKVTVFNTSSLFFEFIADDKVGTVKDHVWITR